MKYVSRSVCESRGALGGVIKEVELLSSLEHPFLVNLWFSFQGKYTHTRTCRIYTHECVCVYVNGDGATCVYWEPPQLIGNQNANELCMCSSFDARPFTWHTPSFLFSFSFCSFRALALLSYFAFYLFALTFRRWGGFIHGVRPVDGRWFKIPFTEPSECLFSFLFLCS